MRSDSAPIDGSATEGLTTVDGLVESLDAARPYNIGFPGATDFDYTELAPLFARYLLNNVGDPYVDGVAANQSKAFEREVVEFLADLFAAPADDRWGYVTSGGSEGNLYALHLARTLYPDATVYASAGSHHSVWKAAGLLAMPHIAVVADDRGEVDYLDLADQIDRHRDRAVVVVANIGTTMTEAIDDVGQIRDVLDTLAIGRRFVHADAALSGVPLAVTDHPLRPRLDGERGVDSVAVSGHKFIGSPVPCGVVVTRARLHARLQAATVYTGTPDTTISGSRSGHTPLLLWHAIRRWGIDGLRTRAQRSRDLAAYTVAQLEAVGWEAWRHEHAFTVVLATPPQPVMAKWVLASHGGRSHIITMPGITTEQVDLFIHDLQASRDAAQPSPSPNGPVSQSRAPLAVAVGPA